MGNAIDEGLLYDLLGKRRAGKFTGEELLWAADHMEVIRPLMAKSASATLANTALPTEMTIGGRTYEILGFLEGGEKSVKGDVMVTRAKEMGAHLGKEEREHLLEHQGDIPPILEGKIAFVFTDDPRPGDPRDVTIVYRRDGRWIQFWSWLGDGWYGDCRVLRRKSK